MISEFWTPARIERLTKMYHDGARRPDIASALGASRMQVVGKIHRMVRAGQLPRRPQQKEAADQRRQAKAARSPTFRKGQIITQSVQARLSEQYCGARKDISALERAKTELRRLGYVVYDEDGHVRVDRQILAPEQVLAKLATVNHRRQLLATRP